MIQKQVFNLKTVNLGGGTTQTTWDEVESSPIFNSAGQLIVAPKLPDLPSDLRKRCPADQLAKWDKERDDYNRAFTLILRLSK